MSLLTTLARLQAVRSGHAEPLATVRHRHLGERPLVLVPLATAVEDGAPLAVLLGTDRTAPALHFVPQPLNRERRFEFLAALADELLPYLESFGTEVELVSGSELDPQTGEKLPITRELCADAPQLIVPNSGGVRHLALLGRATRFRRTAEDPDPGPYPAPPRVPLLGRWLTHLTERAQVPGSSLLLPMTGLLARHWATGQSHLEDQQLGAQLAWHAPPAGWTGPTGAAAAEFVETARDEHGQLHHPPAGPATDPRFDEKRLAPAIARYDAALTALRHAEGTAAAAAAQQALQRSVAALRERLLGVLLPTWHDVWQGLDLLRTLPPAPHVAERWESDRWSYTGHRDRVAAGEPPQPRLDDAVTAARKLALREREQVRLEVGEALDDPLAMAERRLAGEAFSGLVTEVVAAQDTSGKTAKPRPLLTVHTADRPHAEPGREVHRAGAPKSQKAEITAVDAAAGLLTLRLLNGMGRGKEPEPGSVPAVGDRVTFTLFELTPRQSAPLPEPDDTPWTHGGPPAAAQNSTATSEEWA
ncbi:hypothetical protein C7C46_09105 [Streptomyces tateyamensis]|uniref:Uncharacterized protein n=1 Tax=Streptomyces tateyamensis TaxID=565073 RepID=A0A2V4P134_9ACTN|nr:hypothetical protein [Streptomyces tateyamensis]PYC83477.1 hypothetical protein C7C46_09105 [Streptomyces tateyamensis]